MGSSGPAGALVPNCVFYIADGNRSRGCRFATPLGPQRRGRRRGLEAISLHGRARSSFWSVRLPLCSAHHRWDAKATRVTLAACETEARCTTGEADPIPHGLPDSEVGAALSRLSRMTHPVVKGPSTSSSAEHAGLNVATLPLVREAPKLPRRQPHVSVAFGQCSWMTPELCRGKLGLRGMLASPHWTDASNTQDMQGRTAGLAGCVLP